MYCWSQVWGYGCWGGLLDVQTWKNVANEWTAASGAEIYFCFSFETPVLPRSGGRSVSWNTAEAYFEEARLFSSLITTNINKKYLRKPRHDLDLCKLVLSPFYQTDNDELTITGKLLSTEAVTPCESPLMKPRAKCLNSNLTNMNNWE